MSMIKLSVLLLSLNILAHTRTVLDITTLSTEWSEKRLLTLGGLGEQVSHHVVRVICDREL
jgi:hypothetical protein